MLELLVNEKAQECYLEIRSKLLLDEGCYVYQHHQTKGVPNKGYLYNMEVLYNFHSLNTNSGIFQSFLPTRAHST